jgi:hypothetical protein
VGIIYCRQSRDMAERISKGYKWKVVSKASHQQRNW